MINPVGNKGPEDVVRPEVAEEAAAAKKSAPVKGKEEEVTRAEPAQGDKVELSTFAKDIQKIRERLGDQAAERAAEVEKLRKQIEQGTYQVNTQMLAQKMYESGIKG